MTKRGDVVLLDFPFTSSGSKVRPAVIVQNDQDNARIHQTVVAMVTGNLKRAAEPTHLLVDPGSVEGRTSGLNRPSLVVCLNLYTIEQMVILKTLCHLSDAHKQELNDCLKTALELK